MEEFYIEFNTEIDPGKIVATKILIGLETISDMDKKMNIALCEHPLYSDLQRYVKSNPR